MSQLSGRRVGHHEIAVSLDGFTGEQWRELYAIAAMPAARKLASRHRHYGVSLAMDVVMHLVKP